MWLKVIKAAREAILNAYKRIKRHFESSQISCHFSEEEKEEQ